jgi:hypothetical protein
MRNPFRYFNSSPEVIRLTVMMYIRYPLSLRQVEDLFFERGLDKGTSPGGSSQFTLTMPLRVKGSVVMKIRRRPKPTPVVFWLGDSRCQSG